MTLIAADGMNYAIANAFCDVAYVDSYHSLRGNSAWTGSTAAKEAAIIKATDYIEQTYALRWVGVLGGASDNALWTPHYSSVLLVRPGLSWPRYYTAYGSGVIPEPLKKATAELALEALSGALNPNISPNGVIKREKIDVIDTEYVTSGPQYTVRPVVAGLLAPLLSSSGVNVNVVRV